MDEIVREIKAVNFIECDKSFKYAQICSKYLRNPKTEGEARKLIINILDNWNKIDSSTHEMWTDLIEAAGFYPYLDKEEKSLVFKNTSGQIRKEFHKSANLEKKYFHEEQKPLSNSLGNGKNLIISAPTSFGKSILIEDVVASKKYKNIIVIQPTLALLDETRKKLIKYKNDYKIIVRTTQKFSEEKGNLFLLTAERVMEYPELPPINFFVIDEFYKLSAKRDDERSDVLNNAFNLLINQHKSNFCLLGPNIDSIPKGFAEKYNAEFIKTKYSLVDTQIIDKFSSDFDKTDGKRKKEKALYELLLSLNSEQTIIYCSSPARVRYLSKKYCDYLTQQNVVVNNRKLSIIEWIKNNVSEKWGIINCLNNGIGIHDGALQKHITSSIIHYFNDNKLKYLFCTTTIIEGVNTSAKNVVFFDKTKGNRIPIDFFDYSNIKGRAGRMMVHYIGKIFNFNPLPKEEAITVDIPFFEQNPVSDEVLIHINEADVKNKKTKQYTELNNLPKAEKDLFKKNGVSIDGQKNILRTIEKDVHDKYDLLYWKGFPLYSQLNYVLSLAWDNLIKSGEAVKPMTLAKLTKTTFDYGYNKNIACLVKDNYLYFKKLKKYENKPDEEVWDEAIRDAFQILRHWFHYKVPTWLNVINELQKYACEKKGVAPGIYTYYASQLENDFVRENLSILMEYGVPKSAIIKLESVIPSSLDEDKVLDKIKKDRLIELPNLIDYEREKIRENL